MVVAAQRRVAPSGTLSIGEIIARHQQQQRAQDALVKNYTAHARMQQHFRPTVTDPGYDVRDREPLFRCRRRGRVGGAVVLGERLEMGRGSAGVSAAAAGEGAVAAAAAAVRRGLPLSARRHPRRVDELDCYVVRFEPLRRTTALYRGTVWIDRKTFARVRVQAVQGGLVGAGGLERRDAALPPRDRRQSTGVPLQRPDRRGRSCSSPGATCCVEKAVDVQRVQGQRRRRSSGERAAARESDRVMYRETDRGLRYLRQGRRHARRQRPRRRITPRRWRWA